MGGVWRVPAGVRRSGGSGRPGRSAGARRAVAICVKLVAFVGALGCGPPPTVVAGPSAFPLAVHTHWLDIRRPFNGQVSRPVAGEPTWDSELREKLEQRNVRVVTPAAAAATAEFSLGLASDTRIVEIHLVRGDRRVCVARIHTPMRYPGGPLVADWVAELIAREIASPRTPGGGDVCGS